MSGMKYWGVFLRELVSQKIDGHQSHPEPVNFEFLIHKFERMIFIGYKGEFGEKFIIDS